MPKNERYINVAPTKELFISMLVKDIPLSRAILDFVDNSVDGAHRTRKGEDLNGFNIRLTAEPNLFRIADNCGGIGVKLARDYAFRLGRPGKTGLPLRSIGQFGVGMKRALFKLGSKFVIKSNTRNSSFVLDVDIDQWKKRENDWQFEFKDFKDPDPDVKPEDIGTIIEVTNLHPSVKASFEQKNFISSLGSQITEAHRDVITNHLSISLNSVALEAKPLLLRSSNQVRTGFLEETLSDRGAVKVKIYAGISEPVPQEAGWYIYCNGRMILGHDQTIRTGWGQSGDARKVGEARIPRFHNQFDRFRGLVYFESDEARRLPWNTTKTGIDEDSPVYQAVRLSMTNLMRPVIDFLNRLDAETDAPAKPLTRVVEKAKLVSVQEVRTSPIFSGPTSNQPVQQVLYKIQYNKPKKQIEAAQRVLRVSTTRQVGEKTFDYFYERECVGK